MKRCKTCHEVISISLNDVVIGKHDWVDPKNCSKESVKNNQCKDCFDLAVSK